MSDDLTIEASKVFAISPDGKEYDVTDDLDNSSIVVVDDDGTERKVAPWSEDATEFTVTLKGEQRKMYTSGVDNE